MSTNGESQAVELSEFETQFEPRSNDEEVLWEVIEIVAERGNKYRVRWAGDNPETGKPWAMSWVTKHDCTDKLVEEWKKQKSKRRQTKKINKTDGPSTAKSYSPTTSRVSITSISRKSHSTAQENVPALTDDDEPTSIRASTSKAESSKRKRADEAKEISELCNSEEPPEQEHPPKKRKLVTGEESAKRKDKGKATPHVSTSYRPSRSIDSDADEGVASGSSPFHKYKYRATAFKTASKPERLSGRSRNRRSAQHSEKQSDVVMNKLSSSEEGSDSIQDISHAAKGSEAHLPPASRLCTPALLVSSSSPPISSRPLRPRPVLSPGARARLEIFDRMMGISSDNDDPYANMGKDTDYGAENSFEPYNLPPSPPPRAPTPPPRTTLSTGRKKPKRDSPSSGVVPETESSQSQPSLPKPMVNGKDGDAPPHPKLPSCHTFGSGNALTVPAISVMRASSMSPSHTGHIVQQMEDAYVDLDGGNSTTLDTFTQSGAQHKMAQRVVLREEVEESTQEALLGGNPALTAPEADVVRKAEIQPQESVIGDVEMYNEIDDIQMSPAVPVEQSKINLESNQPSTQIDDLQVASMIANPSQGQQQYRDDEELNIDLRSLPKRTVPQNNTDATMRRLYHALSALNTKSDEIEALQRALSLEREKTSKLEHEVKATRPSTTPEGIASIAEPVGKTQYHLAVSELADMRVKWDKEREVWEVEHRRWEEELTRVTTERDRFETNARTADEVRASWDVDRAAFQRDQELWETERNKLDREVTEILHERKTWLKERDRLAEQITSLTETSDAFKAARVEWEQKWDAIVAERAAWTSEQEGWEQQRQAHTRERALWSVDRDAMDLQSAHWEAHRVECTCNKELWESDREKWSTERTTMMKAHEALTTDVASLKSSLDNVTHAKDLAQKDRDFFLDQYSQASSFVSETRAENAELEQKAKIAEGQARDGVALIKSMFESQIKALKEDVDQWKGVSNLLQEKDRRTDDLIRRRAAEQPELVERCRQLEDQVESLHAALKKLGRTHQKSQLRKQVQKQEFHSVELTCAEIEPGEIVEVTGLRDLDSNAQSQVDALGDDMDAEEDECGLYPCKWRTSANVIDQCQQAFDCREDLDRHMHDMHYCLQVNC